MKLSNTEVLAHKLLIKITEYLAMQTESSNMEDVITFISANSNFNDWENELDINNNNPITRWQRNVNFVFIRARKSGLVAKNLRGFYLTEYGLKASQNGEDSIIKAFQAKNYAILNNRDLRSNSITEINEIHRNSLINFKSKINQMDFNKFQSFTIQVLKSCGYFIQYASMTGKDGGIDIIASREQTFTSYPLLKIQVKHWKNNKVGVELIRQLSGLVNLPYSTGMFICSGGFTDDAIREANLIHDKIAIFDIDDLYELWTKNSDLLTFEDHMIKVKKISYISDN